MPAEVVPFTSETEARIRAMLAEGANANMIRNALHIGGERLMRWMVKAGLREPPAPQGKRPGRPAMQLPRGPTWRRVKCMYGDCATVFDSEGKWERMCARHRHVAGEPFEP